MKRAAQRAIRTFAQALLGSLLTSGVLSGMSETGIVDWSSLHKLGVSSMAAGIIALVTFAHNALEDNHIVPSVMKPPVTE